jgi:hypothetical protein
MRWLTEPVRCAQQIAVCTGKEILVDNLFIGTLEAEGGSGVLVSTK